MRMLILVTLLLSLTQQNAFGLSESSCAGKTGDTSGKDGRHMFRYMAGLFSYVDEEGFEQCYMTDKKKLYFAYTRGDCTKEEILDGECDYRELELPGY